jgi:hypothetical protein
LVTGPSSEILFTGMAPFGPVKRDRDPLYFL